MRTGILDELNRDLDEYQRHKLEPEDATPLHRFYGELVRFMRSEPPWSRNDFLALIDRADRDAARADTAASRGASQRVA